MATNLLFCQPNVDAGGIDDLVAQWLNMVAADQMSDLKWMVQVVYAAALTHPFNSKPRRGRYPC